MKNMKNKRMETKHYNDTWQIWSQFNLSELMVMKIGVCAHGRLNGVTPKCNDAKSKMKHPSHIPMPRYKHGWY